MGKAAKEDKTIKAGGPTKGAAKAAKGGADSILDLPELAKTLQEWQDAKKQISLIEKVQESCKTKVEAAMAKHGVTSIKAKTLMVDKRMQSRTGVSAKDLPKDILDKYSKTSTFPVFSIKEAGKAAAKAKGKAKPPKK